MKCLLKELVSVPMVCEVGALIASSRPLLSSGGEIKGYVFVIGFKVTPFSNPIRVTH